VLQVGSGADLAREPVDTQRFGELGSKHLDRDGAVVPEVAGEIHRCRAALTELALDAITVLEGAAKATEDGVGQRFFPCGDVGPV
jgi:hypothetical protein